MNGRLGEDLKTVQHVLPASRSAGTVDGSGIDVSAMDEALFTFVVGDIGASTTFDGKIQESDDNSTFTDITSGAIVQLGATDDNKSPTINVRISGRAAGTRKKYLRARCVVGGSNAVIYGVDAKLKAKTGPQTNSPVTVFV